MFLSYRKQIRTNVKSECSAEAYLRLNRNISLQIIAYLLADGETKADAVGIQVRVELEGAEIRENLWYLCLRDSSARVFYRNENFAALQLALIIEIVLSNDPSIYLY